MARNPLPLAFLAILLAMLLHGSIAGADEVKLGALDPCLAHGKPIVVSDLYSKFEPCRTDYLRADETVPVAMLSGAVDAWTALDLLEKRQARELNPLAQTPGKLVAVQFASVGGHVLASHLIDRRYGRKWGRRTLYGIAVLKFGVAAYQLKAARAK